MNLDELILRCQALGRDLMTRVVPKSQWTRLLNGANEFLATHALEQDPDYFETDEFVLTGAPAETYLPFEFTRINKITATFSNGTNVQYRLERPTFDERKDTDGEPRARLRGNRLRLARGWLGIPVTSVVEYQRSAPNLCSGDIETVVAGPPFTLTLRQSTVDDETNLGAMKTRPDYYNGARIEFTNGVAIHQQAYIVDWSGATRIATLDAAPATAPVATDRFAMCPVYPENVHEALAVRAVWEFYAAEENSRAAAAFARTYSEWMLRFREAVGGRQGSLGDRVLSVDAAGETFY